MNPVRNAEPAAQREPDKFTYGVFGTGPHVATEAILPANSQRGAHVPYRCDGSGSVELEIDRVGTVAELTK